MQFPKRAPAQLSETTERKLLAYATAAATALGTGVMFLTQPAEAKVVYTPVHKTIKPNQEYLLDLNHDGIIDFRFVNVSVVSGSPLSVTGLFVSPYHPPNAVAGFKTFIGTGIAYAFKAGAGIGPKRQFYGSVMAEVYYSTVIGRWVNVKNRCLGLKFQIKGKFHYGWARLNVKVDKSVTATLTGYAYETKPDRRIIAGETEPVPGRRASLAGLALGNPGKERTRNDSIEPARP